ncbi:short-chain dehydrogenase [Colletotrichum musicola]|uniref:Short-chain dehydrogenase n=1 Tax=Colletotrichum musicola TaxID=2175873 RepID=A0A8H6NYL4_9PEZI|nr:short-chain dehydrogenase [Colletotrichum musicola]
MSPPVVLILGAGSRVGAGVEQSFSGADYSVALVSRSQPDPPSRDEASGHLRIRADISNPTQLRAAFAAVRSEFGKGPRVVVYNAAKLCSPPDGENMLSLGLEEFEADVRLNGTAAWEAAGLAAASWKEDKEPKGRFLFTGNGLNEQASGVPMFVTLGAGKSLAWYWIGAADLQFKKTGARFFYADERKKDGSSAGLDLGAESHGKFYLRLVEGDVDELPSAVTFVDGEYKKF